MDNDKKYKTIYLDPPWKICTGGKGGWGTPQNHYKVMDIDGIIKELQWLKPMIAEQAHCYMWVVNNKIEDALRLINELGFTYITNLVWVKDRIGMGQYFRGQHELLFFARKGKPMPYKYEDGGKKVTISSVVIEPREEHSKKPHCFYDIIERISPAPYIELFARNKKEGWTSWGDELDKEPSLDKHDFFG
jgi:N6-adenosine-specific RNA methylase IME4